MARMIFERVLFLARILHQLLMFGTGTVEARDALLGLELRTVVQRALLVLLICLVQHSTTIHASHVMIKQSVVVAEMQALVKLDITSALVLLVTVQVYALNVQLDILALQHLVQVDA